MGEPGTAEGNGLYGGNGGPAIRFPGSRRRLRSGVRSAGKLRGRYDIMKPLVSVLVDTYNQERYIEQAIVSVLEQDFPPDDYEIVVVDDGSTDGTREIVRKFEPRVRLLRKDNGGQASAFNAAVPELRGEIIAFLDGDDWFAPAKLSAVMKEF